MNNNISQLTLSDELEQQKLEQKLAEKVRSVKHKNIQAFSAYAPYALEFMDIMGEDALSIFCTSSGKANIVDYSTGQCWYGVDPELEICATTKSKLMQLPKISLTANKKISTPFIDYIKGTSFISPESFASMQGEKVNVDQSHIGLLVQFGMGIGYELEEIANRVNIDNWLIYEPSIDVFKASVEVFDWAAWLEARVQKGQQVYLQIGNNASSLVEDILHIQSETGINEAYINRHYHHPEMDSLYQYLTSALFSWQSLLDGQVSLVPFTDFCDVIPPLSTPIDLLDSDASSIQWMEAQQRFLFNLNTLGYYYPDIAEAFRNFVPQKWHLVLSKNKTWNLLHLERSAAFYGVNGKEEAYSDLQLFSQNPLKDDPLLDVNGGKLGYYKHYLKTNYLKSAIKEAGAERHIPSLPEKINGIILFGLGLGYQLENLVLDHDIKSLYLYESNFDFFYASLFIVDWSSMLQKLDKNNGRLYLNLGDDGSHAREDLTNKINNIGPYNIVSTYIYPVYHHPVIQQAIFDLKQEFKVIVSMGEYFEHAKYGISHMHGVFTSGSAHLVKRTPLEDYADLVDYPVFIVGNGPSLDASFEYIKQHRNQAIVISCGTALRSLYNYGIRPDFHAEIEQNKATYHWVSNAADRGFLKQITLLSVNGVHPDTADLFGRTMLMFKAGEASTRAYTTTVCSLEEFPELDYAYPTVSNLAVSILCALGMKNLYLFGVDLGFKDFTYHHSKQSDYYARKDGGEPSAERPSAFDLDYAQANGVIPVPGNFQERVYTKHEFRVSAKIIERVLASFEDVQCFNCSDGVSILGTIPMSPKDLDLDPQLSLPSDIVDHLVQTVCVSPERVVKLAQDFSLFFNIEHLKRDVEAHLSWVKEQCPKNIETLEALLFRQRELFQQTLVDKTSLFFFLFWGSMNYYSALLLKLASSSSHNEHYESRLKEAWELWAEYIEEVFLDFYQDPYAIDVTEVPNANFASNN
ncbi:6-hydroxymethylpterin diphosphokinase MptE-like protein [Marinomonas fungiae]|uniref:6-hydroxymethylpterin diphosphokinase MptE-like protein n=1 Tax=Marinomonas fungiae TaxID=1137284 RepID=UPI003A932DD3